VSMGDTPHDRTFATENDVTDLIDQGELRPLNVETAHYS